MLKVLIVGYDKMLANLIIGTLSANHKVVGVLRNDRIKYTKSALFIKDIFAPSRDLSFVRSYKIHDIKADSVNSKAFLKEVKRLKADVILVGSWGEKLSPAVINSVKYCINAHPSLLPKHRGANPYFWALYKGDVRTGVTFHLVDDGYDTGDILFQAGFVIETDVNALKLKSKCCKLAQAMVQDVLNGLEKGEIIPVKQNEAEAVFEKQMDSENLILDLERTKEELKNHIRAISPYFKPMFRIGAQCFKAKHHKILDENEFLSHFKAGEVVKREKNQVLIKCKDGAVAFEI